METSVAIKLNVNVDVNELFKSAFNFIYGGTNYQKQSVDGGTWISYTDGERIISCYFHPSKKHSATAQSKLLGAVISNQRSIAEAGEWACACCKKKMGVGHTFYNTL
ncbi:uncharacterized protein MONOS_18623 [Monocercomonoides exilis]|uniref:uncharacterized protein n=1 Tax=Monocercomonoides exilis TaxID=2049356 RepID=UPI003559B202|nr:hypothetical protein MONOS_18623 [Monocercomonoides exilis]